MTTTLRHSAAGRLVVIGVAIAVAVSMILIASQPVSATEDSLNAGNLPDVAPSGIADPISEAELEDLQTIATQKGVSLQAAIDRYAWNDNFSLAVARISEAAPEAFAGAEIVDADHAWVAFAGRAPEAALEVVDTFSRSHSGVSVEIRTDLGFSEQELQRVIEEVHFAVLQQTGVRNASTSHDYSTGRITTTVVLDEALSDLVLDDLRAVATSNLVDKGLVDVLDSISVSVVRSKSNVLGGSDSNSEHLGGEALSQCTSGFGTKTSTGVRGISTAGHCGNSLSDDGDSLTYKAGYEGTHGDFQWHTGPDAERDDFYSGNSTTLEVSKRDVSGVGAPTVGQTLCKNGKTNYKDCQKVRKLNVCSSVYCNLVQMEARLAASGDSGGPVFYSNTAYGIHHGWHYDIWPFDRDLFSRADRIDNALNIFIATS